MKQTLKTICIFLLVTLFAACGVMPSATIVTPTFSPSVTQPIPSKALTKTPSPTFTLIPTPDICNLQSQSKLQVMSATVFTALEPGGPPVFNQILVQHNPAWVDFQQNDQDEMRSAGEIFHEIAFGPELGTGVNPAVLLVIYGIEQNWELPADGNLISDVDQIRAVLYQHELEWILKRVNQSQYPPMANGATYALYRYFDGDVSRLESWCRTYMQVYNESPLKTSDK